MGESVRWSSLGSGIVKGDRFLINNIATGNPVESYRTAVEAMSVCNYLNYWATVRCGKTARCVVVDKNTTSKFYTDLEYPDLYSYM